MNRRLALVAHQDPATQSKLLEVLREKGIPARSAQSCLDVRAALESRRLPNVIFTGTDFPDGNWRDVLALARAANPPVDVVLTMAEIGPYMDADDTKFYLDAMELGAFDFVVAPVEPSIGHVLANQSRRRQRRSAESAFVEPAIRSSYGERPGLASALR